DEGSSTSCVSVATGVVIVTTEVSASTRPDKVAITRNDPVVAPATYRPADEIVPPVACQLMAVVVDPPVRSTPNAVNCAAAPGASATDVGVTETPPNPSRTLTVALPVTLPPFSYTATWYVPGFNAAVKSPPGEIEPPPALKSSAGTLSCPSLHSAWTVYCLTWPRSTLSAAGDRTSDVSTGELAAVTFAVSVRPEPMIAMTR